MTETLAVLEPATEAVLAEVPRGGLAETDAAVAAWLGTTYRPFFEENPTPAFAFMACFLGVMFGILFPDDLSSADRFFNPLELPRQPPARAYLVGLE